METPLDYEARSNNIVSAKSRERKYTMTTINTENTTNTINTNTNNEEETTMTTINTENTTTTNINWDKFRVLEYIFNYMNDVEAWIDYSNFGLAGMLKENEQDIYGYIPFSFDECVSALIDDVDAAYVLSGIVGGVAQKTVFFLKGLQGISVTTTARKNMVYVLRDKCFIGPERRLLTVYGKKIK